MHNSSTFNPLNLPPNLDQENRFEFCLSFPSLLISKYTFSLLKSPCPSFGSYVYPATDPLLGNDASLTHVVDKQLYMCLEASFCSFYLFKFKEVKMHFSIMPRNCHHQEDWQNNWGNVMSWKRFIQFNNQNYSH